MLLPPVLGAAGPAPRLGEGHLRTVAVLACAPGALHDSTGLQFAGRMAAVLLQTVLLGHWMLQLPLPQLAPAAVTAAAAAVAS